MVQQIYVDMVIQDGMSRTERILKRTIDFILSLIGLVILSPIFLLVYILLKKQNDGPVVFKQERIGLHNRPFYMYKFRSMRMDAEALLDELMDSNEMTGPAFKMKNDPRITPVGRFIRKTSIDELPQLINIIKGDMSIIGPRPPLPREVEQYDDYARQRLLVQPGLTCFWQVQKNRNQLSFDEWLELDIKYIRERSFVVDWKIMFATIATVFRMDGV